MSLSDGRSTRAVDLAGHLLGAGRFDEAVPDLPAQRRGSGGHARLWRGVSSSRARPAPRRTTRSRTLANPLPDRTRPAAKWGGGQRRGYRRGHRSPGRPGERDRGGPLSAHSRTRSLGVESARMRLARSSSAPSASSSPRVRRQTSRWPISGSRGSSAFEFDYRAQPRVCGAGGRRSRAGRAPTSSTSGRSASWRSDTSTAASRSAASPLMDECLRRSSRAGLLADRQQRRLERRLDTHAHDAPGARGLAREARVASVLREARRSHRRSRSAAATSRPFEAISQRAWRQREAHGTPRAPGLREDGVAAPGSTPPRSWPSWDAPEEAARRPCPLSSTRTELQDIVYDAAARIRTAMTLGRMRRSAGDRRGDRANAETLATYRETLALGAEVFVAAGRLDRGGPACRSRARPPGRGRRCLPRPDRGSAGACPWRGKGRRGPLRRR